MGRNKLISKRKTVNLARQDILLDGKSMFYEVEAYKTLRTNLMFALVKTGCKKILITSSVSKEGKSTICINLAREMAQAKNKVLVIDCDLRKPRLHKFFKTKCVPGLSNYLVGDTPISDIINPTDTENLDIIYSGVVPPNPAEMLDSAEMRDFIEQVEQSYNYILIDCAPLMPVSDALVVSKLVDGAVHVILQDFTTHPMVEESLSKLEFASVKLLGFVLNGVKYSDANRYGKYSKYSRYGN